MDAVEGNFLDELKDEEWQMERDESPALTGERSLVEERIEEEEEIIKIQKKKIKRVFVVKKKGGLKEVGKIKKSVVSFQESAISPEEGSPLPKEISILQSPSRFNMQSDYSSPQCGLDDAETIKTQQTPVFADFLNMTAQLSKDNSINQPATPFAQRESSQFLRLSAKKKSCETQNTQMS